MPASASLEWVPLIGAPPFAELAGFPGWIIGLAALDK
jgi:hypothetical protein